MISRIKPWVGANTHSGTENFYWVLFEKFPNSDIAVENVPILGKIIDRTGFINADRIRRYYGIGYSEPSTLAQIGDQCGVTTGPISVSITKGMRYLTRYVRAIHLLYTPYFTELWHCTEIGHCQRCLHIGNEMADVPCCERSISELIDEIYCSTESCEILRQLRKRFPKCELIN